MDITTIFANLLDNALEAAGQAEGERRIRIRADVFHEFVAMRIQNTIAGSNERSGMTGAGRGNVKSELGAALNKAPDETGLCGKNAEKNHIEKRHMGLGLENVRHALEKYGGGMMTEAAGDEFIVNLTIPDASGVEEETSICE